MRRRKVAGVIREWLAGRELDGPDLIRGHLMLALAAEVDDPTAPRYTRPRAAAELRALLAEIEGEGDRRPGGDVDLRALLSEVMN